MKKIAVVGPTGSGKTTIFRLLYKFYENFSGNIFIDGKEIRNISEQNITNILGIIPQDIVLFNESIYFNIQYGRLEENKKRIFSAAKKGGNSQFYS